jgi:predicted kinase
MTPFPADQGQMGVDWRSTNPHTPLIGAECFVVAGVPASGKSMLGAALARRLRAALLDLDVLTGPLTAVVADLVGAAPGDLDDPRVRATTREATYTALVDTARGCLASSVPTVVVAPFTTERSDPVAWTALVERLGAPAHLVWATVPPGELVRRMAARDAIRDRRKLANVEAYLASKAVAPPAVPHLAVDTTAPLDSQVSVVLDNVVNC